MLHASPNTVVSRPHKGNVINLVHDATSMTIITPLVVRILIESITLAPSKSSRPVLWQRVVVWVLALGVKQPFHELWSLEYFESTRCIRKYILKEIVDVTNGNSHQVNDDRVAEKQREAEQDPRQVGSLKVKQTEEVHTYVRITSAPDVHQHDRERLSKEHEVHKQCNNGHEKATEDEHEEEVGGTTAE